MLVFVLSIIDHFHSNFPYYSLLLKQNHKLYTSTNSEKTPLHANSTNMKGLLVAWVWGRGDVRELGRCLCKGAGSSEE